MSIDVIKALRHLGYQVYEDDYRKKLSLWKQIYRGKIENFHSYREYNGLDQVERKRKSLGLGKKSSEDWADALFNDNVEINVDEGSFEIIDKALKRNKFRKQFNDLIEKSFALGTGAMVEFRNNMFKAEIDYLPVDHIYPIKFNNGEVVDCAFVSEINPDTLLINAHIQQYDGTYIIFNHVVSSDIYGALKEQELNDIEPMFRSRVKLFQIIKPAIANNINNATPLGLSIYANAIDELKSVDTAYDALHNEIDRGKLRVYVRAGAMSFNVLENGTKVPIFDNDQTEFYILPEDDDSVKSNNYVKVESPQLRTEDIIKALQTNLNLFGRKVGLGDDYYSFEDGGIYTNTTQVISSNSKFYKTRQKHANGIEEAVIDLVKAIYYLETNKEYVKDITVDFDDSIVEDRAEINKQALIEYNSGLISRVRYIAITRKMTDEQALEFVKQEQKYQGLQEEPNPEGNE